MNLFFRFFLQITFCAVFLGNFGLSATIISIFVDRCCMHHISIVVSDHEHAGEVLDRWRKERDINDGFDKYHSSLSFTVDLEYSEVIKIYEDIELGYGDCLSNNCADEVKKFFKRLLVHMGKKNNQELVMEPAVTECIFCCCCIPLFSCKYCCITFPYPVFNRIEKTLKKYPEMFQIVARKQTV